MLSVSKKPRSEPWYSLALKAKKDGKYTEYISILNQGLEENDDDCIYLLAQCYFHGYYRIKQDRDKAKELLMKNEHHDKSIVLLANITQNYDESIINNLKNHYARGYCFYHLTSNDLVIEAFNEYLKSAEEGDDEAQYVCGLMLLCEYGISKDKKKAVEWFFKSAEQGNINAIDKITRYIEQNTAFYIYEQYIYWCKKEYSAKEFDKLSSILGIFDGKEVKDSNQLDSLVNLHLARHYLKENNYLSWYFFKKTKEKDGKKELKRFEKTTFSEFVRIYKVIITVLCIGKFSSYPKEVFVMIAKEIWKTIKIN